MWLVEAMLDVLHSADLPGTQEKIIDFTPIIYVCLSQTLTCTSPYVLPHRDLWTFQATACADRQKIDEMADLVSSLVICTLGPMGNHGNVFMFTIL